MLANTIGPVDDAADIDANGRRKGKQKERANFAAEKRANIFTNETIMVISGDARERRQCCRIAEAFCLRPR